MTTAMLLTIVANIATFGAVDQRVRHNYQALHRYDTGDVIEVAVARDNSARQRVAPFVYFGDLFPGSVVVVPDGGVSTWFEFEPSLLAFGRVAGIERLGYDASAPPDLEALAPYRIASRSFAPASGAALRIIDSRVGYFAASATPRRFVVFTPDGAPRYEGYFAFVDADLLSEAWHRTHDSRTDR